MYTILKAMNTKEKFKKYTLNNYGERQICIAKGAGMYAYDEAGKKYLDFGAGIAVNILGHCDKDWVKALTKQAQTVAHCSNLYLNVPQADLAEALIGESKFGKMFFCNSGTEANEALIKAARIYGETLPVKRYKILVARNSFHGRTMGALSATIQEKIQKHFSPLLEGFETAEFNDIKSFKAKLAKKDIAAVLIEPIQGESGVLPVDVKFLKELRSLCSKYSTLLFFDEVQCGVARTGKFFAFQKFGVKPDAISMAKGLGGGFPIGAVLMSDKLAKLFTPGTHGTTFGGNPLACAVALSVVKAVKKRKLAENAAKCGKLLLNGLQKLAKKYPEKVKCARGVGLMIGLLLNEPYKNADLVKALLVNSLITIPAGSNAVRFLPPLIVKEAEIKKALTIVDKTLNAL